MQTDYGTKLRAIRKAEGLTQHKFAVIAGINISTVKNYETQGVAVGLRVIERVLKIDIFEKYALWLMIGKTCELAGQIAPALSHSGPEKTD